MKICEKKMTTYFKDLAKGFENLKRDDYLNETGIAKKAFTRTRLITFNIVMLYLFSMATNGQEKSMASVIAELWFRIGGKKIMPSRQAMNKALRFISVDKLKEIIFNLALYNVTCYNVKKFHGLLVYLVDGSKSKVPRNKHTLETFGVQSTNPSHYPLMHILTFYELGTNVVKNYILGVRKASERDLLLKGLAGIKKGALIVADCGFYSSALGYLLGQKGFYFSIRINEVNARNFISGLSFKENSIIAKMKITSDMVKIYEELEDAPDIVSFRIIRIRGKSNGRRAIYIMTNMYVPLAYELAELYYERQRIEDSFKFEKMYGGLEFIQPNTKKHMIELCIVGIIGYYNMVQLALAKVSRTPSPNEHYQKVLNRKVGWENIMSSFLDFTRNNIINPNLCILLQRTANIIKTGRFALRCSLQPLNPHQRSKVKKDAKGAHSKRLEEGKAMGLYCTGY